MKQDIQKTKSRVEHDFIHWELIGLSEYEAVVLCVKNVLVKIVFCCRILRQQHRNDQRM